MKDASAPKSKFLLGALAVCALATAIFAWQTVQGKKLLEEERAGRTQAESALASLQAESTRLQERFDELEREMQSLAESGNQSAEAALKRQREAEVARRQQTRSERELQSAIANAETEKETLASRLAQAERDRDRLRTELEDAATRQRDMQESIAQAQRLTDALRTELQGKEKALASLETAYQRFKDSNQSGSRQVDLVSKTITNLEDINRRRTALLEQAVRRLRDLGDSYRTVAVRIDSNPGMQSTFNAEVGRLQSGVLAVEDQVSQINNLNTQASQLERRLEQARNSN